MTYRREVSLSNPLKVLLIENNPEKAKALGAALEHSHYRIVRNANTSMPILKQIQRDKPDIIIIDIESPDRSIFESLNKISNATPMPIVMFTEQEDSSTISELIKLGISAYVVGEVSRRRVKTIIDIAIARFSEHQRLKDELKITQKKLSSQKIIGEAKRWLMQVKGYSETQAYDCIRKMAMDNSQKMEDVARNMLSVASMMKTDVQGNPE
jgi:two-component system, response regulator / RNA-binding antiterminator